MLGWLKVGALAILAAAVLGYLWHCEAKKAELASFAAEVATLGRAAEQDASDSIKESLANKERTNAENSRLRAAIAALSRSLHNERASRGYVSTPTGTSGGVGRARIDWTKLDGAIRLLDEEVSGIVEAGDSARIDLDSAKVWAQDETN